MIAAGGTGGHVYPALAVAENLMDKGHQVIWMGTRSGLEARVVPEAGIPVEWLSVSGLRGKGLKSKIMAPGMLLRSCWEALTILRRIKPDLVLGMGGFVSGPSGRMAQLLGIPTVIHEQNRVPGTTNRLLAGRAKVVLEAFPGSFPAKVKAICSGNPLRKDIEQLVVAGNKTESVKPRLLILGGSLGAKALNETVPYALSKSSVELDIWHQTGKSMHSETIEKYEQLGIKARVDSFIENIADAYAWADVAVCRAGAMTVSELSASALPAILIPYPHAVDDHQTKNALFLSEAEAAILLPQNELNPDRLAYQLNSLFESKGRIKTMSSHALNLAKPTATQFVAEICLREAKK